MLDRKLLTNSVARYSLLTYQRFLSASFGLENLILNRLALALPGKSPAIKVDRSLHPILRQELDLLLKQDSQNILEGIYPLAVLKPEGPTVHLRRISHIVGDGLGLFKRRSQGKTTVFSREAKEYLEELPRYYRRNFHFQSDGYLSPRSAELYDHQVDLLFAGTTDPMRRMILKPMKTALKSQTGAGLKILEIAAGTGSGTRFASLAFPRAKIVATDLSYPYLSEARKRNADRPRVDFVQGNGSHLPFKQKTFDAVFSIFLFHELPEAERNAVVKESLRLLKPGGFLGLVDSLQTGDNPALDSLLTQFPKQFHEPFYRNYLSRPVEKIFQQQGVQAITTHTGFFSKVCWGFKEGPK